MGIEFVKSTDEQKSAKIYTLKKNEGVKTSIIKVIDYDNDGIDNHDGLVVAGPTSIFTKDEVRNELLARYNYRNTTLKTTLKYNTNEVQLPDVEVSRKNDKTDVKEGVEYNLGSFAAEMDVVPSVVQESRTPAQQGSVTPPLQAGSMPNLFGLLGSSNPYAGFDTSVYDGASSPNLGGGFSFDMSKYQSASVKANAIGTLLGFMSCLGAENSFSMSFMAPLLMQFMMPSLDKLLSPVASGAQPSVNPQVIQPQVVGSADFTINNPAAPEYNVAPQEQVSDVVVETGVEYEEFTKEALAGKTIEPRQDGSYFEKFNDKKGDRIVDLRDENGNIIRRNRYYAGTKNVRIEYFQGEDKGKIYRITVDEDGNKLYQQFQRQDENSSKTSKKSLLIRSGVEREHSVGH